MRALIPAALATLLAAGAAAAQNEIHSELEAMATRSAAPGPPRRGCHALREVGRLPTLGAWADSAALTALVAELAEAFPVRGDSAYALYSLRTGPGGRVEGLRPLGYWLPQGKAEPFTLALRGALAGHRLPPTTVRLRVRVAAQPTLTLEYSERCPAELRTSFELRSFSMGPTVQRPRPARVRASVAADGRILGVQITSGTGVEALDRWLQDTLQRSRATPGTVDGVAVQMEADQTVQIRTR